MSWHAAHCFLPTHCVVLGYTVCRGSHVAISSSWLDFLNFDLRSHRILFALLDRRLILRLTCVFIPKASLCDMLMCCNTLSNHTATVLWMLIMLAFCVMRHQPWVPPRKVPSVAFRHLLMQAAAVCLTDEEATEHCRWDSHSVPGHHGEHPRGGQKQESVLYKHGLQ